MSRSIIVVKVGGSLLGWPELPGRLSWWLNSFEKSKHLILIAGGGRAADWIRELDRSHGLGEERAHRLALHSLDLTAQILAAQLPNSEIVVSRDEIERAWSSARIPILAARRFLEAEDDAWTDPLPRSWHITSDSIAARVAEHLAAARLVLLKSAPLPPGADLSVAAQLGLVDSFFLQAARNLYSVHYLNLRAADLDDSIEIAYKTRPNCIPSQGPGASTAPHHESFVS